jgi:hypothetical protein
VTLEPGPAGPGCPRRGSLRFKSRVTGPGPGARARLGPGGLWDSSVTVTVTAPRRAAAATVTVTVDRARESVPGNLPLY